MELIDFYKFWLRVPHITAGHNVDTNGRFHVRLTLKKWHCLRNHNILPAWLHSNLETICSLENDVSLETEVIFLDIRVDFEVPQDC